MLSAVFGAKIYAFSENKYSTPDLICDRSNQWRHKLGRTQIFNTNL